MKLIKVIKLKSVVKAEKPPKPVTIEKVNRQNSLTRIVSTGDLLSKTA